MSEIERIATALAGLTKAIDNTGLVVDRELRARIVRAHVDVDMPADAEVKVTLGPPAPREAIAALQRTCERLFGVDLPADYLFFLQQHDGMRVDEVTPSDSSALNDSMLFTDHALLSSRGALHWRDSMSYGVTHPDGLSETVGPPVLPFYDFGEGGCVGFVSSAGVGSSLRVVNVDNELVWKPAEHKALASSFTLWFEAFLAAGCEPFAAEERLGALLRQRKAQVAGAADLIVPLSLKRSRGPVLLATVLMVCAVGGLVYYGEWSVGLVLRVLLALGLLAACVRRFISNRYLIEIDEHGILDGFTQPQRIPWNAISDIGCEGSEESAVLLLRLGNEQVRIDLGGVQAPMQTVLRSAIAYWQAAQDARELRRDSAQ